MLLKVIYESLVQAFQELNGNKLRSFLSSLGITIGIFCIISVLSAFDSLKQDIKQSFEQLGNDVLYIDRQPWNEDGGSNWWKYMRRPAPDYSDYEALKDKVKGAAFTSLSVIIPSRTIEFGSSHIRGSHMAGMTYEYADITKLEFNDGRYFTRYEYETGANKVIIGFKIAEELFRSIDPIGKTVKIGGYKFQIIGVLKKEGNSLFSLFDYDTAVLIGFNTAKKLVNIRSEVWHTTLNIKAKPEVKLADLRDEVTGVLRAHRRLQPSEEDNFAINELSLITNQLEDLFAVMNMVGGVIGVFAIIVGIFSVANIMFVSVKERTPIIGIKKALGAKRGVILLEFLIEAIMLCMAGGLMGLAMVMLILKIISSLIDFNLYVSMGNVTLALVLTIVIGIIAGIIPAFLAARMDPVEAIRK